MIECQKCSRQVKLLQAHGELCGRCNQQVQKVRSHETHFACKGRLAKLGQRTIGCCCIEHVCDKEDL